MDARVPAGLTRAESRKFGFTVGPAFLLLAGVLLWRGYPRAAFVAATAGGALVVFASIAPLLLVPVYRVWMRFGLALSRITTPIILALMFFVVFMPTGWLRRRLGGNPMVRPAGDSYWIERPAAGRRSNLSRQF